MYLATIFDNVLVNYLTPRKVAIPTLLLLVKFVTCAKSLQNVNVRRK